MRRLARLLLATMAPALLAGCPPGPEPEPYEGVGVAFNKLHRDPTQACAYVSNHSTDFTAQFASCGRSHLQRLENQIARLQHECDEIFVDPYDLLKCDEDRGVPELQQKELYLGAVLEITVGAGSCQVFGEYFQPAVDLFNTVLPSNMTWQQLMDASLEAHQREYACKG